MEKLQKVVVPGLCWCLWYWCPKNKVKTQHCSCFALIVATTKRQKDCFATHSGVGLRQCFSHQVILRPYCPSKNLYYCTVASHFFVHFSHWQVYSFSTPGGCQCFTAFPHCSSTWPLCTYKALASSSSVRIEAIPFGAWSGDRSYCRSRGTSTLSLDGSHTFTRSFVEAVEVGCMVKVQNVMVNIWKW